MPDNLREQATVVRILAAPKPSARPRAGHKPSTADTLWGATIAGLPAMHNDEERDELLRAQVVLGAQKRLG